MASQNNLSELSESAYDYNYSLVADSSIVESFPKFDCVLVNNSIYDQELDQTIFGA